MSYHSLHKPYSRKTWPTVGTVGPTLGQRLMFAVLSRVVELTICPVFSHISALNSPLEEAAKYLMSVICVHTLINRCMILKHWEFHVLYNRTTWSACLSSVYARKPLDNEMRHCGTFRDIHATRSVINYINHLFSTGDLTILVLNFRFVFSHSLWAEIAISSFKWRAICAFMAIIGTSYKFNYLTLSGLNLPLSSSSTTSRELLSQFSTCSGWRWLDVV